MTIMRQLMKNSPCYQYITEAAVNNQLLAKYAVVNGLSQVSVWSCDDARRIPTKLLRLRSVPHYRIPPRKVSTRPTINQQQSTPPGGRPGGTDFCR